jgi:hypothetical protein
MKGRAILWKINKDRRKWWLVLGWLVEVEPRSTASLN